MWISEEEASIRIGSHKNLLNRVQRDSPDTGVTIEPAVPAVDELSDPEIQSHVDRQHHWHKRQPRNTGPILSKKDAADAAIVAELLGQQSAADAFSKSQPHIHSILKKQQQDHRNPEPNLVLSLLIEEQRTKVRDRAFERLNVVLEHLDADKIKKVDKARELAHIATQLATVADKMLPKEMQQDNNVHFHMFRPEVKTEQDYEHVQVGEERPAIPLLEGEITSEEKAS